MKTKPPLFWFIVSTMLGVLMQCSDDSEPRYINTHIPSGFVKDIPIIKTGRHKGQYDYGYKYVNTNAYEFLLDSLEGGYDSLEIRIWLGHSMALVKNVVILKFNKSKWKAQLISYNENSLRDSIINISTVRPKSGWKAFSDSLFKLQILTLPDGEEIIGGPGADGIGYYFEVATISKYRFYGYANPEIRPDAWQAVNVLKIASLLESEFGFHYTK